MRRAVVIVGLALALSMLGGAAAAPIDWKSLPYFNYDSQWLRLNTDRTWSGARYVNAGHLNFEPDASWPKLKREWIWSASCGQQAQHVVFSKEFVAPGAPIDGKLTMFYGPGNRFLGFSPYESAIYEINGIEIGRLGNVHQFPRKARAELTSEPLSQRALGAFRHGTNRATIRVVRAPLKRGDSCTRPNTSRNFRIIAVEAELALTFGGDLIAIPPRTKEQIRRVVNGQKVIISGSAGFANFGPSTSLGGTVYVSAGGDGVTALLPAGTHAGAGLDDCELESQTMTCHYAELRANSRTAIDVTVGIKVNTGSFKNGVGELLIQWSIHGRGRDEGGSNNAQTKVVLCAPGATTAPC